MARKKKADTEDKPLNIDENVAAERLKQEQRRSRKLDREYARRIISLEKELEAALFIKGFKGSYTIKKAQQKDAEAVAVIVASDWHVEEVVHGFQTNELNRFNEQICHRRVKQFWSQALSHLVHAQAEYKITTVILALLGDFISGGIHEELQEGNRLLPIEALREAQEHLKSGIQFLLQHTDVNLVVPCKSGNHGRMTKRQRIATEAGNSLERFMYHSLASQFEHEPRITFLLGDGYHTYVRPFRNYLIRFHHGHAIKYYGGVGGISIPMNKAVAQWNKAQQADLDVCGHFHQYMDGGNWVVNGSLIGYSAYALSIKASPEPPRQAFFLVHKTLGKDIVRPIHL